MKLKAAEYKDVFLRQSVFQEQFERTVDRYLHLPNDSLLYNFRKRKYKTAPGRPLTGWYGRQSFNFGQFCGALAKMYAQTQNTEIKAKLLYLWNEWADCIEEDGYGFSPEKDRYQEYIIAYEYEKLVGGLVDAYAYAGIMQAPEWMKKITGWYQENMPERDRGMLYQVEWYTLSENLYRAGQLFGEEQYTTLARVYEYPQFWERFQEPDFSLDKTKHAYSHVNSLCGAAMAYEVSGEEQYLDILKAAYEEITGKHIYATGGYGPCEDMFGKQGYMGDSLKSAWDKTLTNALVRTRHDAQGNCEVSCCTWAAFKVCRYLMELTGDLKYADWAEKLLYNGVLSLPPVSADGKIMYYANYYVDGGLKSVLDRRYHGAVEAYDDLCVTYHYGWQCCTGTYPQAVAEYANMIYFRDDAGICISQYIPSVFSFRLPGEGRKATIECMTKYPEEEEIRYLLKMQNPEQFRIRFRIPKWVKTPMEIRVNGKKMWQGVGKDREVALNRVWEDGDVIEIRLPLSLYFESIDEKNEDIAALCYGPLVMVTDDLAAFVKDKEHPEEWIWPVEGEKLRFRTKEGSLEGIYPFETREFAPYCSWPEQKWYFMYFWFR